MIVCRRCGMANPDGSPVCAKCGASLGVPGGPQMGGNPGSPQMGGNPGSPQTGGYPGGPQTGGYSGGLLTGGYPGGPRAGGYPGGPQAGGYPGGPQMGGYPGGPQMGGYASRKAVVHVPSLVFAVLCLISLFSPFITLEIFGVSQSVSLLDGAKGAGANIFYLLLGLFIVAIILILLKKPLGSLIMAAVIMIILVMGVVSIASDISELMAPISSLGIDIDDVGQFIKPGIGAYFLGVGSIGLLIAAFINNAKNG